MRIFEYVRKAMVEPRDNSPGSRRLRRRSEDIRVFMWDPVNDVEGLSHS